jgi:3-deoxy-7-phosphoheptulonate synthase
MYKIEKKIPTSDEIKKNFPISKKEENFIISKREEISKILEGNLNKKILIIGPCSAWPKESVIEYAKKLKKIEKKVENKILIIMRVYTQKPRTRLGWTGPVNQPNPFEDPDIEKGIKYCREMMMKILEIGLPIADEALFTHLEGYFSDILSWVAIGARSCEDQEHRVYASMIPHPVGIKNPTSGNIKIAINSVIAAQNSHVFLLNGKQIKSLGNKYAHLILRGGDGKSNISKNEIIETINIMDNEKLLNPSIIIDLSHENSIVNGVKNPLRQPELLFQKLSEIKQDKTLNKYIKGFMVESFLKTGNQDLNKFSKMDELDLEGLSITDPCIGFEETEKMILKMYDLL